jgi:hypothetical protein
VIISQDSASDHVWSIEEIAGLLETRSNEVLNMNETNRAVDKLQGIEQLWVELGCTKLNTPEYEMLIERIRVESEVGQIWGLGPPARGSA